MVILGWRIWAIDSTSLAIDTPKPVPGKDTSLDNNVDEVLLLAQQWQHFEDKLLLLVELSIDQRLGDNTLPSVEINNTESVDNSYAQELSSQELAQQQAISQISFEQSHKLIEAAIMTGIWTRGDNEQLNQVLADVSTEQRDVLLNTFITALNEQKLAVEAADFPVF